MGTTFAQDKNTSLMETLAFVTAPYEYILTGPSLQALGHFVSAASGPDGVIYLSFGLRGLHPGVYIYHKGLVRPLAGTDRIGFRDGPAEMAMFHPHGRGYDYLGLGVDQQTGAIYVADPGNRRIRKIDKDAHGRWMVTTIAGGGTKSLEAGRMVPARDLDLGNVIAVTVDAKGDIYTSPSGSLVRIDADGMAERIDFPKDGYPAFQNVVGMDADRVGNVYGVTRGRINGYFRYNTKTGKFHRLTYKNFRDNGATVDGPLQSATFFAPTQVAAAPDGSAIYGVGGDEGCLRRIKEGRVATLQKDGTWKEVNRRCQFSSNPDQWNLGAAFAVDPDGNVLLGPSQFRGNPLRRLKIK